MPCHHVKFGNGVAIVCTPKQRKRKCQSCGGPATLQCDHPVEGKKSGTCDAHICIMCAVTVGPDLHHCLKTHPKPKEPSKQQEMAL